jgi:predicted nucleic acid-binding protein
MADVMLDTNAFNRLLDGGVSTGAMFQRHSLFVTHIQQNELQATRNATRRKQLLEVFTAVEQTVVPTAAAVWDVSEYDGAEYGSADGEYDLVLAGLNQRNGGKPNNAQDALIAVTALKRSLLLVTNDGDLAETMRERRGSVTTYEEFVANAR